MSKSIKLKAENNEDIYPYPYYPIGSIYLSVNNTNPKNFFGGKWEQIKDKFLLCCGNIYTNGATGGSSEHNHTTQSHALSVVEIPPHQHTFLSIPNSDTQPWAAPHQVIEYKYVSGTYYTKYTDSAGGGQPHSHGNTGSSSNMPPYLAVYVWKRIA